MRRAPRIPVDLPVSLFLLSQTVKGRITDLSLTGAHIALPEKVKLHVPIIDLKFPLFSTKSPDIEVLARVARLSPSGVGVEFLDLDSHNRSRLWDSLLPLAAPPISELPVLRQGNHRAQRQGLPGVPVAPGSPGHWIPELVR